MTATLEPAAVSHRDILMTYPTTQETPWESSYDAWRHGGWYTDARYPSGACGCVSNNYTDKKWRIACGPYFGLTFSTRRDAANAERAMTLAMCRAAQQQAEIVDALSAMLAVFGDDSTPGTDAHYATAKARAAIAKATDPFRFS